MSAIWNSIQAMPNSSMWWPIALMGFMLWPRSDGGGIGFSLALVAPSWFTLGPVAFVWLAWALVVAAIG